jgi:hypothetical protein
MRCSCQPLCLLQIVLLTKRRSRSRSPFRKQRGRRATRRRDSINLAFEGGRVGKRDDAMGMGYYNRLLFSFTTSVTTATLATTSSLVSFSSPPHHPTTHSRRHRPGSSRIPTSSPTRHRAQPTVRHRLAGVLLPLPSRYLRLRARSLPQPPRADTDR